MKLPYRFTTVNRPDGVELPNLSKYVIAENGDVWSAYKDRMLKPLIKDWGYRMVFLTHDDGTVKWYYVHRLVATAYHENPDNLRVVRHLDNNPGNNHKDNLAWSTHKENSEQMVREGRTNTPKNTSHWAYGKTFGAETREKMAAAKRGVSHPRFKGYYIYKGLRYASMQELADKLGTYAVKVHRMVKSGEVLFSSVTYSEVSR